MKTKKICLGDVEREVVAEIAALWEPGSITDLCTADAIHRLETRMGPVTSQKFLCDRLAMGQEQYGELARFLEPNAKQLDWEAEIDAEVADAIIYRAISNVLGRKHEADDNQACAV